MGHWGRPAGRDPSGTAAQSYDPNGNLLNGRGRGYAWDTENRPSTITTGSVSENYSYDADGARLTRTAGGQTTIFLNGLWEENRSTGAWKAYYTLNGQVVAVRDTVSQSVSYLHGDHLGSISAATGSGGAVLARQEYDVWGYLRLTGRQRLPYGSGQPPISQTTRNFTGQELDGTGLLFYHARYYDPGIGRFVSADTIVPGSNPLTVWPSDATAHAAWGTTGSGPANPQELNRYSYGLNNPLRTTDPTGHCPWCIGAIAGAIIGAGIAYGTQVYNNYQSGMDIGQAMTTNISVAAVATGAVAGAVVGGSLGLASTGTLTGYTVGTALEMGAIGSVTNMAGNAAGQFASSGQVNLTDVGVAGVVGFAAGAAAPLVGSIGIGSMAGGYVGSVGLGATANSAQYVATQSIKGDQITGAGLAINALSGGVAGVVGGATSKVSKAMSFDTLDKAYSRSLNADAFLRANVTRAGLTRGFLSGGTSNWNYERYMPR